MKQKKSRGYFIVCNDDRAKKMKYEYSISKANIKCNKNNK